LLYHLSLSETKCLEYVGALSIIHSLDYEALQPTQRSFTLNLTAGAAPVQTTAILDVAVVNMDDNAPFAVNASDGQKV
jgi:hypothetical protein